MIDLDKYLNIAVEFKLNGELLNVKLPSAAATKQIGKLEESITEENYLDVRCKITQIILNSNEEGKAFTPDEIEEIPFKVQNLIATQMAEIQVEVESDPN